MQQSADGGFDLLVAASEGSLKVAREGKTILIASKLRNTDGCNGRNPLADLPDVDL